MATAAAAVRTTNNVGGLRRIRAATVVLPAQEKVAAEEKEGASLTLFSAFLWLAGAAAVCAPLGGESDKDRRPDDKSFMVLRPHVDGGRRRT